MNKKELVVSMSKESGLTQKDSEAALNAFIDVVTTSVTSGEKVLLVGFGVFESKTRAERKGRNPQNGSIITIPATKVPVFKASKILKEEIVEGEI